MGIEENRQRYEDAVHGMQTGIEYKMQYDTRDTQPKHLRVGINNALDGQSAIAHLLIKKGVFTEEEYIEAVADAAEIARDNYQQEIREHFKVDNIHLR